MSIISKSSLYYLLLSVPSKSSYMYGIMGLETPGVDTVKKKVKGMSAHFHTIGGAHMKDFHECQKEYGLPKKKPQNKDG